MHNFEPVKKAGITPGVLHKLVGVSRVTASQWYNGHSQPHKLHEQKVANFLKIVDLALAQGLLPLKVYPGRKNVMTEISKALVAAVHAAKNSATSTDNHAA